MDGTHFEHFCHLNFDRLAGPRPPRVASAGGAIKRAGEVKEGVKPPVAKFDPTPYVTRLDGWPVFASDDRLRPLKARHLGQVVRLYMKMIWGE